jgi:hypothetical protein
VKRAILVDTSVARSAGSARATDVRAAACRDALKAIRKTTLHAVLSSALREEYDRQAMMSKFFRRWLLWMTARRRIWEVDPPLHRPTRAAARRLLPAPRQEAVEKDLHLVSAALASDRRVLSGDDRMRDDLATLAAGVRALAQLHWANPETPDCLDWLSRTAPDERTWMLAPG